MDRKSITILGLLAIFIVIFSYAGLQNYPLLTSDIKDITNNVSSSIKTDLNPSKVGLSD
ncbi:Uncharacterised protein [uncultured archaeon]|nr:Uncharacterised protein [uncultured archaeon]